MKNQKRLLKLQILISSLASVLLLGVGVSAAWLTYAQRLNTISVLQIPSRITISGANRSEMLRIPLEMTSDDTEVDDTVTLRRVFCIESTDDYYLGIAHTTNISGLNIKIFPVSNDNSNPEKESGAVKGSDGVRTFYYDPDGTALAGGYRNKQVDSDIAIPEGETGSFHDRVYNQNDNGKVQKNAEPLYWVTNQPEKYLKEGYSREDTAADGKTIIHYRYYVLELSWNIRDSETDMLYLLASHGE